MEKENKKEKTSLFLEGVGLLTMLAFGAFVIGCAIRLGAYAASLLIS